MKAIVQDAYGSPEVLRLTDICTPAVGDDDVLVRVHAAGVHPGDEVFGWTTTGSLAEYVCVTEDHLAPKPDTITMEQAGAVTVSAMPALHALRDAANAARSSSPSDTVITALLGAGLLIVTPGTRDRSVGQANSSPRADVPADEASHRWWNQPPTETKEQRRENPESRTHRAGGPADPGLRRSSQQHGANRP